MPIPLEYNRATGITARQVLLRWEKFRLIYNALLIATVFGISLLVHPHVLALGTFWMEAVLAGVLANVCFCLGPFIDIWLFALGCFRPFIGLVLFFIGTVLS